MTRKIATRSEKGREGGGVGQVSLNVAAAVAVGAASLVPGSVGIADPAAPGGDAIIEAESFPVGANSSGAKFATCPAGARVVGGGINTIGPITPVLDYYVEVSGPLDETGSTADTDDGDVARSWYASIYNQTRDTQVFKVFALCSQDSDANVEAQPLSVGNPSSAAAIATCPAGTRAVGGGVGTTGPVTAAGVDYIVEVSAPLDETGSPANTDDGDVARSWYASIWNNTGANPAHFKVFALCSQGSDATVQAQEFPLNAGSSAARAASCPAGRRVLGGGVNAIAPLTADFDYGVELSGPVDATGLTDNTVDGDVARHWYTSIWNDGDGGTFRVIALCASEGAAPGGAGGVPGAGGGGAGGGAGEGLGPGVPGTCGGQFATILGTPGADTLWGTSNADVIAGLGNNDVLKGLGAKDRICGGAGKDRIAGGAGADFLSGGAKADRIFGGPGRDRIIGGPGKDQCNGGPATDKVSGC